jgi:hypothetical protein
MERTLAIPGLLEHPADERVGGPPDAQGAREQDRGLQLAELHHLRDAEQLAEPVANVDGCRHALVEKATAVRENRSNTSPHRVAANERRVTHTDARNVRDRVVLTGLKDAGPNPELARPGSLGIGRG